MHLKSLEAVKEKMDITFQRLRNVDVSPPGSTVLIVNTQTILHLAPHPILLKGVLEWMSIQSQILLYDKDSCKAYLNPW